MSEAERFSKNSTIFPDPALTAGEIRRIYGNIENWGRVCINAIDHYFTTTNSSTIGYYNYKKNLAENIRLVKYGLYNTEEYQKLMGYYGYSVNNSAISNAYTTIADARNSMGVGNLNYRHPVDVQHFDIITPKLELLKGEEIGRPINWQVVNMSPMTSSRKQKEKMELMKKFAMFKIMTQSLGIPKEALGGDIKLDDGKAIESIEQIEEFFNYQYTEAHEKLANDMLTYMYKKHRLEKLLLECFSYKMATGIEVAYVGAIGDDILPRVVDPLYFDVNITKDETYVENAQYCRELRYLTIDQVAKEFWDVLDKEQYNELKSYSANTQLYYDLNAYTFHNTLRTVINTVQVGHYEWTSLKKVAIRYVFNEYGDREKELIVDESEINSTDDVEVYFIPVRWEGDRIGADIFCNIRPVPNQLDSVYSIGKVSSRYTGTVSYYSLVDKAKPYQHAFNLTAAKLKKLVMSDKGKILLTDYYQIPKDGGWDLERFFYFIDVFNTAIINSKEHNDEQGPSNFTGFQSIDLSMSEQISHLITQLEYYKKAVGDVLGISLQREGVSKATETASGIERSVTQSAAITESLFYDHNDFKERFLQSVLNASKHVMKEGEVRHFVLDDASITMLEVTDPNFKYEQLTIFVTNSTQEHNVLKTLQNIAQQMFAADKMDLPALVRVLRTRSIAEAEKIAVAADENKQKKMMELQQQNIDGQMKAIQEEGKLKQELEHIKGFYSVEVAKLRATGDIGGEKEGADVDTNKNGIIDTLEYKVDMAKIGIDKEKVNLERQKLLQEQNQPSNTKTPAQDAR